MGLLTVFYSVYMNEQLRYYTSSSISWSFALTGVKTFRLDGETGGLGQYIVFSLTGFT